MTAVVGLKVTEEVMRQGLPGRKSSVVETVAPLSVMEELLGAAPVPPPFSKTFAVKSALELSAEVDE